MNFKHSSISYLALATCLAGGGLVSTAPVASAAPVPRLDGSGHITAPARTQISFAYTPTGTRVGTANENEARPGLSIVKLYIADYVMKHGTAADKEKAVRMVRTSDDQLASELYAKYPDSINATAREYGLTNTHGAAHWGNSTTSTRDTVTFLEAKKRRNPADPVLLAMQTASPVAADGYAQDYGTATLPGVTGTKWGWSDDRTSVHASASIGPDFSVAASTYGDKHAHTADVHNAFGGSSFGSPGLGSPGSSPLSELLEQFQIPPLPLLPSEWDSPALPTLSPMPQR